MKLATPDHSRIRSVCKRHRELVRVLKELDGSCMPKLRQVYCQAVNMLIRLVLGMAFGFRAWQLESATLMPQLCLSGLFF